MFIIHPTHFLPPKGQAARRLALLFLCIAPLTIGLLALALGQDANWDLRNYHYYNAYAFLNNRYAMDLLPSQTPYFYNPLMDVPFFWMAMHFPARVVGFSLGTVQGLNIVLLFLIAYASLIIPNPRHKVVACAGLAMLGMLGGGGIAQIGTTFGDNITSLGILLSAALVVRHMDRLSVDAALRAFFLCLLFGIPAGCAMGFKLPAVTYGAGLCLGFFLIGGSWKRRFILSFAFGLGATIGVALTYGQWAMFLESHFGSPVFPYFNDIFKSPLEPAISGRDVQYLPHGWREALLMPFIFAHSSYRVGEINLRDWRIPILYALLPLSLALRMFFGRSRGDVNAVAAPFAARYLLASFAISYFAWLMMFNIYRYAVTLEMIAPLLIVFAVGMLPLKVSTRGLLTAFILAMISASIVPGNWGRRDAWLDKFVEVSMPKIDNASNLMVLMAGIEPYSHLLPAFPSEAKFVRIESNFAAPGQDKGINALLHERVDAHRKAGGQFMMLIPPWQMDVASRAMAAYHLAFTGGPCQNVTDRLFGDKPMNLCPVVAK